MKKLLIAFLIMVMPLCANAGLEPRFVLGGDCLTASAMGAWNIEDKNTAINNYVNVVLRKMTEVKNAQQDKRGLAQEDMIMACLETGVEVTSADCANTTDYEECYANSDCAKFIMNAWKCEKDKLAAREVIRQEALKVFQKAFPCTNGKNFPDSELCQHTFFKNYGVGRRQASALINAWARRKMLKEGTDAVANTMMKCNDAKTMNGCMQCELGETGVKFEFCFASLDEVFDKNIHDDVMAAGCKLYDTSIKSVVKNVNVTYGASSFAAGMDVSGLSSPYDADNYKICDGADKTMCLDMHQNLFAKLGAGASWIEGTGCAVNIPPINDVSQLEQIMGIDSFYFCNLDIQVQATQSTVDALEAYVFSKIPRASNDFVTCQPIHRIYNGDECSGGAVLRCMLHNGYADEDPQPFDMVFADLSEWNKQKSRDSSQALSCVEMGGTFTGDICIMPDRDACMKLREANLVDCPTCKKVWWDEAAKVCRLPESSAMRSIEKGTEIAMYVGGTAVTVAIAAVTGPGGVMLALEVISAVGTTMAAGSELYIDSFADKFFVESSNCHDATCAKNIVYTHLVKMQNYANQGDLSYAQLEAADTEIARLVELIPEQDDFWVDLINSGAELSVSSAAENANAFDFSRWEPEHWVRALGTALEMVTLVQAAGEMFLRFNPKTAQSLNKAVNALKTKVSNVIASLSKSDDAADAAFRAQLSAKRAALRERIASGEIIRGTDGPLVTPERVRLAAPAADDAIVIPKGQMAGADKWRHPSNPTRIYTTEEMSDIIHRSSQYGGDPSALTGWEPVLDDVAQSADDVGRVLRTIPEAPVSVLDNAKQKLTNLGHGITDFDAVINDFVHNDGPFPGHFTRSSLTDGEFDELAGWFKSEYDLTLSVDNNGLLIIDRPTAVDAVAAMKAKFKSGQKKFPTALSKQMPANDGGVAGYRIMDDGSIVHETSETVATKTTTTPRSVNVVDDVADAIGRLPSSVPQTLDEEKKALDMLEDFFSANPNKKPSSTWSARSAAEDAYIRKYGEQLEEIGRERLRLLEDEGYVLGSMDEYDLDYVKRERLGISDVEHDFIKTVEEWLDM